MNMRTLLILLTFVILAQAQDFRGTATFTGRLNASQAVSTSPAKLVSSLPATCSQGFAVFLTTAPLTEWLHVCTSANTWTKQALTTAVLTTGSYSNPSWLTGLAWSKLSGVPSTFTPSSHTHLAADIPATVLYSTGSYSNPSWLTSLAGSKISGAVPTATALAANGTNCPAGQVPLGVDASGNAEGCWTPSGGGGSGTVTSVGLSMPSQFAVSGSPVTTSGTLTAAWNTQTANTVFAGPGSGGAAAPTFRALVAADLPASAVLTTGSYSDPAWLTLTKSKVGLGNVENTALSTWSGSANINTIGTLVNGSVPWANVSGKPTFASANTASAVVQRDASGNFSAGTITAALTGNASTATTLQTARSIFGVSFNGSADIGSRSGNTTEVATVSGAKTTNKQLMYDASGNIVASSTDIGAGGGGGGITLDDIPCLPGDLRWVCYVEEFGVGTSSTSTIATHGWYSGGTVGTIWNAGPNIGVHRLTTGTSSGNNAQIRLQISLDNWHDYTDDFETEVKWVFSLTSTADMTFRIGVHEGAPSVARGAALYGTNGGNFQIAYTNALNTESYYDLGVALDTGWHTFRIRTDKATARKFYYSLDGGTEVTLCESGCDINTTNAAMWYGAGVATTGVHPRASIVTNTSGSKSIDLDYFSFKSKVGTSKETR